MYLFLGIVFVIIGLFLTKLMEVSDTNYLEMVA